ncbi:hypothetical protein CYMTET_50005 [Cymbomonas tetramitiformis]|uniref:Uncharacterized protein n=1 Tax=Cymbomonas tetramitiformis TaxID=36881 RepID=A0AAE0EV73_9CHLO|nr:hypothetical protein CYMTET_50005 [Cymbomonas tetramitiformis]
MGSGAPFDEQSDGSVEDESEYPLRYFDESEDDYDVENEDSSGHLALPHFSDSQLAQEGTLDTSFQSASYGGVLDSSLEEDILPQHEFLWAQFHYMSQTQGNSKTKIFRRQALSKERTALSTTPLKSVQPGTQEPANISRMVVHRERV